MRRLESQRGDLATKQDIGGLAAKVREIAAKQDYLKWIMGIGFTVLLAGFGLLLTVMLYLHSDTKAEMSRRFAEVNQRFTKMEAEMKEIKQLLQRGQR